MAKPWLAHNEAALASLGVHQGDRVALMLPNLPQFVIAFYSALKLGPQDHTARGRGGSQRAS